MTHQRSSIDTTAMAKLPVYPRRPDRAVLFALCLGGVIAVVSSQDGGWAQAVATGFITAAIVLGAYAVGWFLSRR